MPSRVKPIEEGNLGCETRGSEDAALSAHFREQVQASLDDERASLADEPARAQMAALRQTLLERARR